VRAPVVAQIFAWRVTEQLGYRTIASRLNADPGRYPPPIPTRPQAAKGVWCASTVTDILHNPKYTGYMVWNRVASKQGGRHNPPEAWIWSPEPTHPPIVSRELFAAAQQVAPQRRGSRSGAGLNRHPQTRRSYPLRSLVTCELCGRRMRGKLRRKARRDYLYYACEYYACEPPRSVGRQVAAARQPEHPASVLVRGDVLLGGVLEFFALRLFSPQRRALLAQDVPDVTGGEVAPGKRGAKRSSEPLATSRAARRAWSARSRSATTPAEPCSSRSLGGSGNWTANSKPDWLSCGPWSPKRPDGDEQAVDLLELLPLLTPDRLAAAPEPLLRALFERFQLQVRYHKPQNRATVRVALSDDSLDGLLASVGDIEGGAAPQDPAVSSAGAVSLAGGAPRGAPPARETGVPGGCWGRRHGDRIGGRSGPSAQPVEARAARDGSSARDLGAGIEERTTGRRSVP
jgi:recombinase